MARSTYVYIVTLPTGPIIPFTVKHECVTYLKRRATVPFGNNGVNVSRHYDGRPGEPVSHWVTAQNFIES